MATVDQAVFGTIANSVATITQSVTSNATGNRGAMVFVMLRDSNAAGSFTCTYGGVSMTSVASGNQGATTPGMSWAVFKLANPLTGAQNVVATKTGGGTGSIEIGIITATGVDQTNVVSAATNNRVASATSATVTPTAPGASDVVGAFFGSDAAGAGWTSGVGMSTGQTQIGFSNSGANADYVFDQRPGSSGSAAMTHATTTANCLGVAANLLDVGVAAAGLPQTFEPLPFMSPGRI